MGSPHSKPDERLRQISREVIALRSSLRHSRQNLSKDKKEAIVGSLANQGGEVSALYGKAKQEKIEETLKDISDTMTEVLKIEPKDLDMATVETDSFVRIPVSRNRTDSLGSLKSQRTSKKSQNPPKDVNKNSVSTLRSIEAKIGEIKQPISTAIENKDSKQLRVYEETIKVLAGDLEMIKFQAGSPLEQNKDSLMKKLSGLFHKVSKTLKDLKRDDKLYYLSKQNKKEKALNDLADIELHLSENESLLDRMMKEKNSSNFTSIRNNVVQIDQRLTLIDIIDSEIKEKRNALAQKLSETVNNLDKTMARREFDSKFSKAVENYEKIVRNFDKTTNLEDTKQTLETLRNSIQNLEEVSDTTKNRKRDLLGNINKQLGLIDEAITGDRDRKTIQQIVEDNVVLRKNIKSIDKEYTVIDQFYNHWHNIKNNFDLNSYSNLSLLRIDNVLEEIQATITDLRLGIANKCDTYPPTNLSRKQSQSVPRLTSSRQKSGSQRSLNQIDSSKVIKTKAHVYQLSSSELLNVDKQQENYKKNRFSRIEEIKMQVYYVKEKIDDSHNKNLLRTKLESYLRNLNEFMNDSNKTIANNANMVSSDIIELLHRLDVEDLREKINTLTKRVQNFNGTRYDKEFDEIKDDLIKVQVSLENLNVPPQYGSLHREKNQLLEDIYCNIVSLQEKGSYHHKYEDENAKLIKAKLQTLHDKVKRFSGSYKGVLYNKIERELNKLLLDAGERVDDKMCADEITKNAEKLLQILKQRSYSVQSFKASKPEALMSENKSGMAKIKNDLINIKHEIDSTSDDNVDAFVGLQSRLDLVILELGQISVKSDENLEKEKDIFSNEAQTLKNVVDAKVALGQQPLVPWPDRELQPDVKTYPKNDVNKEIEKFENAFRAIKNEIGAANNEEDVQHKYYKLAQDTKKLIEKLSRYKFIRDTDLHVRKTTLLGEMQYYVEVLEKEAQDTNYMINLERTLDKIETLLHSQPQNELQVMAKELQAIQDKLDKHKFNTINENLRERKISIQQKADDLTQKLKKMEDSAKEIENKQLQEATKKLDEIEEKVKSLKPEISSFVGLQSDSKFYELDETTMRLILILDKFDTDGAELQKRKIKLLKELHQLGQILDERTRQTHEVVELEEDLEKVFSLISVFSGNEDELIKIKEEIERIGKKIQTTKVNNELISRKNGCVERFSVLFNKVMTLNTTNNTPLSHDKQSSSQNVIEHPPEGSTSKTYSFADKTPKGVTKLKDDELLKIENDLKELTSAINKASDKNQLQAIDEALTQYTHHLNNLRYPSDSPQHKKKVELFEFIENLTDYIEKIIGDNEVMIMDRVEDEVNQIANIIDSAMTREQVNQVNEKLIWLQNFLSKLNNDSLKLRIDGCMLRIIFYLKHISECKESVIATTV